MQRSFDPHASSETQDDQVEEGSDDPACRPSRPSRSRVQNKDGQGPSSTPQSETRPNRDRKWDMHASGGHHYPPHARENKASGRTQEDLATEFLNGDPRNREKWPQSRAHVIAFRSDDGKVGGKIPIKAHARRSYRDLGASPRAVGMPLQFKQGGV